MTRHDWGPAALSIGLRLTFIGLWISLESHPTWLKILAAGVIMGIALFEKLSAVVLLLPFFILLWSMRNRLSGALRLGALGFGIGALPLILVNLQSWVRGAGLISFSDVQSVRDFSIQDTIEFVRGYLELGQGVVVRGFILGEAESSSAAEPLLLLALLSIAVLGLWQYRSNTWMRLGGYFAASYLLVGIALYLLPRPTNFYHWILATPFQYAAGACALAGCLEKTSEVRPGAAYRVVLALLAIGLLAIRIPGIVAVESAFAAGKTSIQFHPDFNRMASLASEKSGDSVFVAADWGTATQIYCVAQGKPGLVYELFWTNPGDATVKFLNETAKPNIYVLVTGIGAQFAAASDEILQVMANAPEWQEAPIEKEFAELHRIKIRKFVRRH